MPKELTHWWLADQARLRLPPDSPLRELLDQHLHCYLLGAVLPDTLLHPLPPPHRARAIQLANNFHNPRTHSYLPLIRLFDHTPEPDAATLACLLGIASHIEADAGLHPFVYSQCGEDLGMHYRLETDLDLWLLHNGAHLPAVRVAELLTPQATTVAAQVLATVFDASPCAVV